MKGLFVFAAFIAATVTLTPLAAQGHEVRPDAGGIRVEVARGAPEVSYERVVAAAHEICSRHTMKGRAARRAEARCVRETIADAIARSESLDLAAVHQARSGVQVAAAID